MANNQPILLQVNKLTGEKRTLEADMVQELFELANMLSRPIHVVTTLRNDSGHVITYLTTGDSVPFEIFSHLKLRKKQLNFIDDCLMKIDNLSLIKDNGMSEYADLIKGLTRLSHGYNLDGSDMT